MEKKFTITEAQKIPLISLAQKVDNDPDFSMNKAYKTAVTELGFKGKLGDFIDLLKENALIATAEQKEAAAKAAKTKKIVVYSAIGIGVISTVVILSKVLTKK